MLLFNILIFRLLPVTIVAIFDNCAILEGPDKIPGNLLSRVIKKSLTDVGTIKIAFEKLSNILHNISISRLSYFYKTAAQEALFRELCC